MSWCLRQASETGQLFGSVSVRDIIASFEHDGVTISRSQIMLDAPIKTIGKHTIAIAVHPEVEVGVTVTVARSADEAERINRGEDISTRQEDQDAAAEALAAAGEFFDPEAQHDDAARQEQRGVRPITLPSATRLHGVRADQTRLGASAVSALNRPRMGPRGAAFIWRSAARATLPGPPAGGAAEAAGGARQAPMRVPAPRWKPPPRFRLEPPWTRLAEPAAAQGSPGEPDRRAAPGRCCRFPSAVRPWPPRNCPRRKAWLRRASALIASGSAGGFSLCRLGLCRLVLGRVGLGRIGLASLRFGVVGFGVVGLGVGLAFRLGL